MIAYGTNKAKIHIHKLNKTIETDNEHKQLQTQPHQKSINEHQNKSPRAWTKGKVKVSCKAYLKNTTLVHQREERLRLQAIHIFRL